MKKMLFILNPQAGTKKANKQLVEVLDIFNRAGYDVSATVTARQGDAAAVAARRAGEMDIVVCCGGDGTFNETMAGIMASGTDVPLGYIPAGSTNDFAASLHLSSNILQAAQDIVNGKPVRYDVGSFGGRYFSYVASFGAFTRTTYMTPQTVKNALGHTAYVLEGIRELSRLQPEHVRMELDGQIVEDDFLFGAISNSLSMGGILTLDPKQVDMRDGKFEILLVRAPKDMTELGECILALQKQEYNCAMITFRSAKQIRVTTEKPLTWSLDGEREEAQTVIDVKNLHLAVQIVQREEKL